MVNIIEFMARPREYDEDYVRGALMATFLEKGFAGSSLADLESGSGLNRRQIYNNFGDKLDVFLQAIRDFTSVAGEQFLSRLESSDDGIDAVRETLFGMIRLADTPRGRLGCLVCNTAREPIAAEPDVKKLVDQYFRRIERGYRSALKRAVELGELPGEENLRSLSRFFLGVHVSLCVLGRGGEPVAVLTDLADEAMKRLR